MERTNSDDERVLYDMIAGGVGAGQPIGGAGEDDVSSFLNESGEGMELEPRDEGQTNTDDEGNVGPLTTPDEVYILSLW